MEHYCTLFDRAFLSQGLALHGSLARHGYPMRLWALCADEESASIMEDLMLSDVTVLRLADVEREDLLAARVTRSAAEYYWTLTPALIEHVLGVEPGIRRLTYVDADCYFFSSPSRLLAELDAAGRNVLITEHDYAPEYDQSATSGRFCVQFMTFSNTAGARSILHTWRSQCIEWCFARHEDGRFGDQRYLEPWPSQYPGDVHVLRDTALTLAPWNVSKHADRVEDACMYHFHGLRVLPRGRARLVDGYRVTDHALERLYRPYLDSLANALRTIRAVRPGWDARAAHRSPGAIISDMRLRHDGRLVTARLPKERRADDGIDGVQVGGLR